ncbi:MAG: DUF1049 domain-containing protein [Ottowia sp.]|nr:DUF1049 domain-containing protein [Ottowia sp.]
MNALVWFVRGASFIVLFILALQNTQEAILALPFGYTWRAPLILIICAFFCAGIIVGFCVLLPKLWRQQRRQTVVTNVHKDSS